jgi:hypothetical protein
MHLPQGSAMEAQEMKVLLRTIALTYYGGLSEERRDSTVPRQITFAEHKGFRV